MEKIEKPWGYEIIWAKTSNYVGKILFIRSGHRLSKQYHNLKEETVLVKSGTLLNYDENDIEYKINPGETLHINPKQVHRFAAGKCDVELIEISTTELDDVVRLEDDYNRNN